MSSRVTLKPFTLSFLLKTFLGYSMSMSTCEFRYSRPELTLLNYEFGVHIVAFYPYEQPFW